MVSQLGYGHSSRGYESTHSQLERNMNETVRRQEVEATEFDDELSDEALDRQEAALSANCGYTAGH